MRTTILSALISLFASAIVINSAVALMVIPTPVEMSYKGNKKVALTQIDEHIDASLNLPDEGYTLEIKGATAHLRAKTAQGMVWVEVPITKCRKVKIV